MDYRAFTLVQASNGHMMRIIGYKTTKENAYEIFDELVNCGMWCGVISTNENGEIRKEIVHLRSEGHDDGWYFDFDNDREIVSSEKIPFKETYEHFKEMEAKLIKTVPSNG